MVVNWQTEKRFHFDALAELFASSGGTDLDYLKAHYFRFCRTKDLIEATWGERRGTVLDVGAHWLHQSSLYALDRYDVIAGDLPVTLDLPNVQTFAATHGITLVPYASLEHPDGLARLPGNSVDLILFTEIIEHITFNPIQMWNELHRLLRVGGRVVVTTPNYYRIGGRFWAPLRLMRRLGGGISVEEILQTNTYGHHWKEYSLRELLRYFQLLSPDFILHKAYHVKNYYLHGTPLPAPKRFLENAVPHLRPNLHVEMILQSKNKGIVVTPSW